MKENMEIKHNPENTSLAQQLRKNATRHERRLWYDFLCRYPVRFRRQVTVGRYIVDFYCAKAKLAIELDGSQHFSEDGVLYDEERSAVLRALGITVLRFANSDIDSNFSGVCQSIDLTLRGIMSHGR